MTNLAMIFGFGSGRGEGEPLWREFLHSLSGVSVSLWGYREKDALVRTLDNVSLNDKLIIIGHSYGGNTAFLVSNKLWRETSLLILLDPVHFLWGDDYVIPPSVRQARCFYDSDVGRDWLNLLLFHHPHKISNASDVYQNVEVPCSHAGFLHVPEVRTSVSNIVGKVVNS